MQDFFHPQYVSQSLSQLQQPQVQREGDGPDFAGATPVNWEMFGVQSGREMGRGMGPNLPSGYD